MSKAQRPEWFQERYEDYRYLMTSLKMYTVDEYVDLLASGWAVCKTESEVLSYHQYVMDHMITMNVANLQMSVTLSALAVLPTLRVTTCQTCYAEVRRENVASHQSWHDLPVV